MNKFLFLFIPLFLYSPLIAKTFTVANNATVISYRFNGVSDYTGTINGYTSRVEIPPNLAEYRTALRFDVTTLTNKRIKITSAYINVSISDANSYYPVVSVSSTKADPNILTNQLYWENCYSSDILYKAYTPAGDYNLSFDVNLLNNIVRRKYYVHENWLGIGFKMTPTAEGKEYWTIENYTSVSLTVEYSDDVSMVRNDE
jgi:hypothetical protein